MAKSKKQSVPTVRFKGFNDGWKLRKLRRIDSFDGSIEESNNEHFSSRVKYFAYTHVFNDPLDLFAKGISEAVAKNKNKPSIAKVFVPTLREQKAIGNLLGAFDYLIDLQERTLKQLEYLKHMLLQSMFADNGYLRPEIRFSRYSGKWVSKKLSSVITKEITGKAMLSNARSGSVEYLDAKRLNGQEPFYSDASKDVSKSDIVMLWVGAHAGRVYTGFEGALGSTLKAFQVKIDSQFVYQYLLKSQQDIFENYRTPGIPRIQNNFMDSFEIWLPSLGEQKLIGNLLKKFDEYKLLQKKKLDQYKQLKKFLLQNLLI